MSYEAGAHKSQMQILNHLLHVKNAKFSELQKTLDLDSDYVTFHINALVKAGYVSKIDSAYTLTNQGKEYANRMDTDEQVIEKQPKISIALVVENNDGTFLAQQRLKQPYYGYWGRPTGKIRWGETMEQAAARELKEESGLTANWRIACLYHKMDYTASTKDILEDKYFIVAHGTSPTGTLISDFDGGKNAWMTNAELLKQDKVFETIVELNQIITSGQTAIFEKPHYYNPTEY